MPAGKLMSLLCGAVIGVHGWRRHAPFFFVQRLANLVEVALDLKGPRSLRVAQKITTHNF